MNRQKTPNFLIIGAPKAGTTSLWHLMRQHPDVFLCEPKEPKFFNWETNYARGWDWYLSLFKQAKTEKAIGEASTGYSRVESYPDVPERIAEALPDARIIYIVRHPLGRIESGWLQCLHTAKPMPRSFKRAVRCYRPLIESTRYWRNLNAYRKYFSDDKILLLFFEDIKAEPRNVLRRTFGFLGVDPDYPIVGANVVWNRSVDKEMDRSLVTAARRLPGFGWLREVTPAKVRAYLRRCKRVAVPARPEWDVDTRRWVLEQVREDAEAILKYAGKNPDFWKF